MELTKSKNSKLFNECKYLPMFELILPFNLWRSIQTQYEFKYDLKWLYYVGFSTEKGEQVYLFGRNNKITLYYFTKRDLFSVNRKLKPGIIMFPYLPPELWSLVISYTYQHKFCYVCGKDEFVWRYPALVCKQWCELVKIERSHYYTRRTIGGLDRYCKCSV